MRMGGGDWVRFLCAAGLVFDFAGCRASLPVGDLRTDGGASVPDGGASRGAAPTAGDAGRDVARDDGGLTDAAPTGVEQRDASVHGDASAGDAAARTTAAICPGDDGPSLAPAAPPPARVPTELPVSCNPLSRTLVLPQSPADAPGLFQRCASFSAGAVSALALSPHGDFAAMVNSDGVARIVGIASQQVVALLAPPRARITRVAFSPDGASVAAVAGAEHEVTLYRTANWTAVWTITLPGTLYGYTDGTAGAVTFSPDGASLAVSPGTDLYLLDAATGALRATYPSLALLDVAYAWGGQRLVAADATLTGSCVGRPDGGSVVVLDPVNLTKLETVASWAGYSQDNVPPAFRASPIDDLVFVPPSTHDMVQTVQAFKVSDGSALPRPSLPRLPVAFLVNGDLLIDDGGELEVQPPAGGTITAKAAAPTTVSVFAVSALGRTVGMGGDGADLLHVWNIPQPYTLGVCAFDDLSPGLLALSGDGRLAAVTAGIEIAIVRPDDGTRIETAGWLGNYTRLALSRTGRYLATLAESASGPVVFATPFVDLSTRHPSGFSSGFLFAPDEQSFYNLWSPTGPQPATLEKVDLGTGRVTARPVPAGLSLVGLSRGCPMLFDALKGTVYRSCETCDETPIPTDVRPGTTVVAADGTALMSVDPPPANTATLRSLPGEAVVRTFAPPSGATSDILALPVSVGPAGAEVLEGGRPDGDACYDGPQFPLNLYDTASGTLLDQLPPGGTSDDRITRLAYGREIWCRQ